MILTCPECATSYFVDDARIPSGGRTVKCANCGARWMAAKEAPAVPTADGESPDVLDAIVGEALAAAAPDLAFEQASESEPVFTNTRLDSGKAGQRKGRPKAAAWGAAAAMAALLVTGGIVFRSEIMGFLLGAGAGDLVIEGVKAEPVFEAGRPVLSVSGEIHNKGREALEAPSLHIRLLDKSGKAVAATMARAEDAHVPAGARRYFIVAMVDPPRDVHDLEVTFASGGGELPAAKARMTDKPHEPAQASGADPDEAKPLAPGSPDALDDHHG